MYLLVTGLCSDAVFFAQEDLILLLFNLKKLIGALLMPLPTLLLLWCTRWQKSGKTILTPSWLLLLLFSLHPLADRIRIPDLPGP